VDYAIKGEKLQVTMHNHAIGDQATLEFVAGGLQWADILPAQGPWHTGQPY